MAQWPKQPQPSTPPVKDCHGRAWHPPTVANADQTNMELHTVTRNRFCHRIHITDLICVDAWLYGK